MANYAENMYNWLKQRGLAAKYEFAGIYCIKVNEKIVYIGKSGNMLRRIAQHYAGIQRQTEKKYAVLAEARRRGHNINFDVLYYAKSDKRYQQLLEIGKTEGEYIRRYKPFLNTQIPNEQDYHKYETQKVDAAQILKRL